ncbi:glycine dehydrogenase [Synechococcus sp. PCC 7335]|uniref:aminomethyl-transferring glycine dehydrogenase n=1 Tax=Synechococcus sp. (strain ATCC 29403 / PCC 7335) TaxID=91464 RepID=UPI00017EE3FF|nr:aminomethyl-transferring glycine dehydrogenase [Synechococcus sp. PCC 7335]EDX84982.1 glycine dehydrogenase [Synechococcus sp. PCC 7335]
MSYDLTTSTEEVIASDSVLTAPPTTKERPSWIQSIGTDRFDSRHLGPTDSEIEQMLKVLGTETVDALINAAVPAGIRLNQPLKVGTALSETEALKKIAEIAAQNQVYRSYIGLGYHACVTPPVIQRNILENPGWYTQYTPYQPEISQGRLEALLNYQTMVTDLTGLEIANASLLDEGTAAAEAMSMSFGVCKNKQAIAAKQFWVSAACHPQTIEVIRTRAQPLGITVVIGDHTQPIAADEPYFGMLLQYPATDGAIYDYTEFIEQAHQTGAIITVAADLLSLTLLRAPGEFGADIAVGNTQRFGVPLGYGGPHAAYFATKQAYARKLPGRLVGLSKDSKGRPALRLALQTREQHIRRDSATSNICTAQVLLAIIASTYAVYHGPTGLRAIAHKIQQLTSALASGLKKLGYELSDEPVFDTLSIQTGERTSEIITRARTQQVNLRIDPNTSDQAATVGISIDETTNLSQIAELLTIFAGDNPVPSLESLTPESLPASLSRTSSYLTHSVFNQYHSETELLRYLYSLQKKDLSLADAMIPLGSCTMKLNATAEMMPITWPEFGQIHPFAPLSQTKGYQELFTQLEDWLCNITGFAGISLQPNAGSQGEYAGLLVIREYHKNRGEGHRNICLIPQSAHGTNPASAVMAGMKVVGVKCDDDGNIDVEDLIAKAEKHKANLSALMVTYPSTHGVFEESIKRVCEIIHTQGGQVYMDGANMNAQVGLCSPGDIGADVCHLNLHKTFCIPHGGGGPGVGPIGVAAHLVPFLPGHSLVDTRLESGEDKRIGAVSAAPWGSSSILPISWMYIQMMGFDGLKKASEVAILSANYIAKRLEDHYDILYKGSSGLVAHECIIDLREFKKTAQINVDDIAKRMIDYGFHPPTMSWPVAGTIMVEPTESESLSELDRFCDAMIAIRAEIEQIESGVCALEESPLHYAPHTTADLVEEWHRAYSPEVAVFPTEWTRDRKFWPSVNRIDQAFGDRNLVCTCPSMDEFAE